MQFVLTLSGDCDLDFKSSWPNIRNICSECETFLICRDTEAEIREAVKIFLEHVEAIPAKHKGPNGATWSDEFNRTLQDFKQRLELPLDVLEAEGLKDYAEIYMGGNQYISLAEFRIPRYSI